MGQIISNKVRPDRCNLAAIVSGGSKSTTVLDDGEIWLVDTSNVNKGIDGYGKYDCYIIGDGDTDAQHLRINKIDDVINLEPYNEIIIVKYHTDSIGIILDGEEGDLWIQGNKLKKCVTPPINNIPAIYQIIDTNLKKIYVYNNILFRYYNNTFIQVGEVGPEGPQGILGILGILGIQGNTGVSVGDNFEAFSTAAALEGKTTAQKQAMLSDGNVVIEMLNDIDTREDAINMQLYGTDLINNANFLSLSGNTAYKYINASTGENYSPSSNWGSSSGGHANYYTTGYFDVSKINKINYTIGYESGVSKAIIAAYDESKTYVSANSITSSSTGTFSGTWEKASGTKYVRFSINYKNGTKSLRVYDADNLRMCVDKLTTEAERQESTHATKLGLDIATYIREDHTVAEKAGVTSYTNGARLSNGALTSNSDARYIVIDLAKGRIVAGDVIEVSIADPNYGERAFEFAFFHKEPDPETGVIPTVAVGDEVMDSIMPFYSASGGLSYTTMGYLTVPNGATHLVWSMYYKSGHMSGVSVVAYLVHNVSDYAKIQDDETKGINKNIVKQLSPGKSIAELDGEIVFLSGLEMADTGIISTASSSSYRIAYTTVPIPKGSVMHFTATSSASRTIRWGITYEDPTDVSHPIQSGIRVEVLQINTINGSWDIWLQIPETGWLVWYYYNASWSGAVYRFHLPSDLGNIVTEVNVLEQKVFADNWVENFQSKYSYSSRRVIRGDNGVNYGSNYGASGQYYTINTKIDVSTIDSLLYYLPFPNSAGLSKFGGSVAAIAAYDENEAYLPEESLLYDKVSKVTKGTWTKGENTKYVRFTVCLWNGHSTYYSPYVRIEGTLESRIDAIEAFVEDPNNINTLNRDRESIVMQCQNTKVFTNNLLRLVHFSDLHGDTTRLKRIVEWCDSHEAYIDDIVNTGDTVKDKFSDGNPYGTGSSMIPGVQKILTAIGNHDCATKYYQLNSTSLAYDWYARRGASQDDSDTKVYNRFIKPYIKTTEEDPETGEPVVVDNWGVTQPEGAEENGYTWYYKDYESGFRLIVLDSMNYTSGTGTAAADDINFGVQRAWYQSILENARLNNLAVITAYHFVYRARHGIKTNMMPWGTANGSGYSNQSITGSTTKSSSTADYVKEYSNSAGSIITDTQAFIDAGGTFVCHLVGHSHGDRIFYVGSQATASGSTPTSQLSIMVDAACCTSSANHYGAVRVAKGRAQDSFNYVCFDKTAQRITIVKIGIDANIYGQHVDWTSVYYGGEKAEQYMQVGNTTYTSEEYIEPDHDDDGEPDEELEG